MNSLQIIDLLLGESLEQLSEAAGEIRKCVGIDNERLLFDIGRALCQIAAIRDKIYEIDPTIKRDLVIEYNEDSDRFNRLNELSNKGGELEDIEDFEAAKLVYQQLLNDSKIGFFKLIAEAGLYRAMVSINSK